jgi:hypothetical protein
VMMASFAMGVIMVSIAWALSSSKDDFKLLTCSPIPSHSIKTNQMFSHLLSVKSCINSSRIIRHAYNTMLHKIYHHFLFTSSCWKFR